MISLQQYLKTLSKEEKADFARRCGTSIGYLRKACYARQTIGANIAVCLDRESGGAVSAEELRPDIDWAYMRRK